MEQDGNKPKTCGLKPWKAIGHGRRVARVVWMAAAGLWLFTLLQVVLGALVLPPFTPLMVQRLGQQLSTEGRSAHFERDYVRLGDISPRLVTAVVYSEDGLFMYHHGFDVKQMKKACHENRRGRRIRGGSTISQQTAKNVFLPHSRTMLRKALEAYYTVLIEKIWGKRRIMEVYLNVIEFGDGIYGAEAASQHYFGHPAATLSATEAAQLAATLPSPLKRNPASQTPYFKQQSQIIRQRMNWGAVDLDMPAAERKSKYKNRETLWDFIKWYVAQ